MDLQKTLIPNCRKLCVVLIMGLSNCGHPATERECQEIVQRIATLELTKPGSNIPVDSINTQVEAAKKSLRETTIKECVGRRLTDRAMRCVREAKTPQQISDDCFK